MEFAFNDEQEMIRDSAAAFLKDQSSSEAIRQAMATELGYEPKLWNSLCSELYWQAIHLPESCGGMGLGYVELAAVFEQMGQHLLCAPYFSTVAMAANAIRLAGDEARQQQWLGAIAEGKTATLAFTGSAAFTPAAVTATCQREDGEYLLNGSYQHVIDAASSELLVLAARDESGAIQLFACESANPAIKAVAQPSMDQTRRRGSITVSELRLPAAARLCAQPDSSAVLQQSLDLASIALAAEQVGMMQRLLDMAVDYTKERKQFNRPIASFQAIKHMAADMMLATEAGRSAVYYAACIADEFLSGPGSAESLAEAASIAVAWCSENCFKSAADTLQMHGGVGFTWEYDVHLFFKRAKASEHFLGDSAFHRERVATILLGDGQ